MKNLAIFASGNGSNAQRIAGYFEGNRGIRVALILSDKPNAFVLQRAKQLMLPSFVFSPKELRESTIVLEKLHEYHVDFIVLAGFLLLLPDNITTAYPGKIVNIHPALLPAYGGKGMYGHHVHEAVIASGDKESGISIHMVNEKYDEGAIVFQARCPVLPGDTPETLAIRIHALEYEHYPVVIENILQTI